MLKTIARFFSEHVHTPRIDWVLFSAILLLLGAGLVTMNSFIGESNYFFEKQIIWITASLAIFFVIKVG